MENKIIRENFNCPYGLEHPKNKTTTIGDNTEVTRVYTQWFCHIAQILALKYGEN